MTQPQRFTDEPLPPTSCRKFWDRPAVGNEFSVAWDLNEVDADALACCMQSTCVRAAEAGKEWAIDALVQQAEALADEVARRNPTFDIDYFERLVAQQIKEVKKNGGS